MNEHEGTLQLPPALSTLAQSVDGTYDLLFWVGVALFAVVVGAMLLFVVRFRRRPGVQAQPTGHSMPLEVLWTFAPLALVAVAFYQGFDGYLSGRVAPADAIVVRVAGKRFQWDFEYPGGATSSGELTVPVGRPIKLVLTSTDVTHGFYVPDFRVQRDASPGSYSTLWFRPTAVGESQAYCSHYCGAGPDGSHHAMLARIKVVSQQQYDAYIQSLSGPPPGLTPAQWGERLFSQNGCNACHQTDGTTAGAGPNVGRLFGTQQALVDGSTVAVDEAFLRESITSPAAKVAQGFQPIMPPFAQLRDIELDALVAYVRSLGAQQ